MPDLSKTLGVIGAAAGVSSGLKGASKKKALDITKSVVGKGVAGYAAGSLAGSGLDYVDRKAKENPSQEFVARQSAYGRARYAYESVLTLEKHALDLKQKFEILRQSLTDKALADAVKKKENTLDPIKCEVCGYQGNTTNDGRCPECGAVGGLEKKIEDPGINFYGINGEVPKDGISVYDADHVGREEFPW